MNISSTMRQRLPTPDLFRSDSIMWMEKMKTYLSLLNLEDYLRMNDQEIDEFSFLILANNPDANNFLKFKGEWLRDKKHTCEALWISIPKDSQDRMDPDFRKDKWPKQM